MTTRNKAMRMNYIKLIICHSVHYVETWYDRVGMVVHRELCKRLKFDQVNKWYMPQTEFIQKMRYINLSGTLRYKRIT